ncbi:peroxiredoxin family protein [Myxococcota bacterium]|nr:peroxiredoxin family protein [Myxococcota bacterium]
MILRTLASVVLLALLGLNALLPTQPLTERGPERRVRHDVEVSVAEGGRLPPFELRDLEGRRLTQADLAGQRVLLTFERSIDWCPFSKARLVELRDVFAETPDLRIVWVMSDTQIDARTRIFIAELGLGDRILFLADTKSSLIRQLGLLKPDPDLIEVGVPHPTTLLLDREGVIRFVDVRENFHFWLDPRVLVDALASID